MTALAEVAAYVPAQRVTISSLAPELGLTPMQVKVFRATTGCRRSAGIRTARSSTC